MPDTFFTWYKHFRETRKSLGRAIGVAVAPNQRTKYPGTVTRLRSNGALFKPYSLSRTVPEQVGRCSPADGHSGEPTPLKSAILPALGHQPLPPRVQPKIAELRGRNSLRALYSSSVVQTLIIGGTIVWMYCHITAGWRPANLARQFRMRLM